MIYFRATGMGLFVPAGLIKFDEFTLDCDRYELLRPGGPVKLEKLPMELLILLVTKDGHLVTRQEIIEHLWGKDVFLDTEHGINTAVRKIRTVLRDDPEQPRFVQTVTGKGYRFIATTSTNGNGAALAIVASPPAASEPEVRESKPLPLSIRRRWFSIPAFAVAIVACVIGMLWLLRPSLPPPRTTEIVTDKDTIVLADFANSTGDAIFDDTLKTALSVSLRQSPFLNVLSDSEVAKTLQLMTRPASTKLTPEVARELCQRAGSKAYIAGSIGSLGSEYVLGLKAVNCQSGDTLAQEQVTAASKEKVLDALGEAASKLRGELGESLATVQKFDVPLEQATTSSLEALKAYSLGRKAVTRKARPQPCRTINVPSSLIRILPWATGQWAATTSISARSGGPASTSPRHSSCGNMPASGKSWRSPPATIGM